jgi:hypothetical protein
MFYLECAEPLGMKNRDIADAQITASSRANSDSRCYPLYGRLNAGQRKSWCAGIRLAGQYLQVDLLSVKKITKIATQGRLDLNQFVTEYTLAYVKDTSTWTDYKGAEKCTKV